MDNIIVFENSVEFYNSIKTQEQIVYRCPFLSKFKDYMDAAFSGCSCRKAGNVAKAEEVYVKLNSSLDQNILSDLKNALGKEKFIFNHNGTVLFTL
jgi:hypothetical protein